MSNVNRSAVTLSIRVLPEIRDQLENLSEATNRTKSFLAAEAIECYLATQAWQVSAIKTALKKANSKKPNFVDHNKVIDWLESWGTKKELKQPK
jgi:RHH-type transcriptional regulator, rel operon repressor / antitoxin RelB